MKRLITRDKVVIGLGSIVIFLLFYLGFQKIGLSHQKFSNGEINKTNETVEAVDSKYPGIHLETITKETDQLIYAINLPTIEHQKINDTIQSWIGKQKEIFLIDVKNYSSNNLQALLNIQLTTIHASDSIYNFVFEGYQIIEGANGFSYYQTYTFDLNEGTMFSLEDFLNLTDENKERFKEIILDHIDENEDIRKGVSTELLEESLKSIKNLKWSIDSEKLSIYWDQYEIAIGATGNIQLSIPLDEINFLLTDKARKNLYQPDIEENNVHKMVKQQPREQLDPNGKYIALTFDDGPHSTVTPKILNILKEYQVQATFFMLGNQAEYYPELVHRVASEGHEIGNHSQTHIDLSMADEFRIHEELNTTNERIKEIIKYNPALIRPPYGAYNDLLIKQAKQLDQSIIMWSVDSLDWQSRDPVAINQEIMSQVTNGSIILMHDIHEETAEALPEVITNLKAEGYDFVIVTELLNWLEAEDIGPHFGL